MEMKPHSLYFGEQIWRMVSSDDTNLGGSFSIKSKVKENKNDGKKKQRASNMTVLALQLL